MSTLKCEIIDLFLRRVEKDIDFFNYHNLDSINSLKLAKERSSVFLDEAIGRLLIECQPDVDFTDRDSEGNFNFDMTAQEKILIPSLMYESYLQRDIAYLKTYNVDYTSSELRVFDPSGARNSFESLYRNVQEMNTHLMDRYMNTARKSGAYKSIDYSTYDFSFSIE